MVHIFFNDLDVFYSGTVAPSVDDKYNSFVSLVERFLTWFKEKKMSYIPCECTEQIVRKKISSMLLIFFLSICKLTAIAVSLIQYMTPQ